MSAWCWLCMCLAATEKQDLPRGPLNQTPHCGRGGHLVSKMRQAAGRPSRRPSHSVTPALPGGLSHPHSLPGRCVPVELLSVSRLNDVAKTSVSICSKCCLVTSFLVFHRNRQSTVTSTAPPCSFLGLSPSPITIKKLIGLFPWRSRTETLIGLGGR